MSRTLSLPIISSFDSGNISDASSADGSAPPRFPHTRAQLSALARQYKPPETYDSDAEGDDFGRVSSFFVAQIVGLIEEDREDELKSLLKETYTMEDETVCPDSIVNIHTYLMPRAPSWSKACWI
jgi:hypothetical protein